MSSHHSMLLYIYNNGQVFLPTYSQIFGSDVKYISLYNKSPHRQSQVFQILKTNWKKLERKDNRCQKNNFFPRTTECITKFIEEKIQCRN
jgi:hypothetical protein